MMERISETDLIINADGSIYHLNLLPRDVADTVITVGDPDRVGEVSRYFDTIELKKGKREFITHTGTLGGKRITVLSTGIGTDNIDIVFNELDALANIDFETRLVNQQLRCLNIIRIGTSGAVQADIPVDSLLVSEAAYGLDALMHYYKFEQTYNEKVLQDAYEHSSYYYETDNAIKPYFVSASSELLQKLAHDLTKGITVTAPGFYSPQGRQVRAKSKVPDLMKDIKDFFWDGNVITNLEMETAGIYGLARALGHQAISFNVILANRATNVFSQQPAKIMEHYIKQILDRIVTAL